MSISFLYLYLVAAIRLQPFPKVRCANRNFRIISAIEQQNGKSVGWCFAWSRCFRVQNEVMRNRRIFFIQHFLHTDDVGYARLGRRNFRACSPFNCNVNSKNNHQEVYHKTYSFYVFKRNNILNHLETDAYDAAGGFSDGSDNLAIYPRKTVILGQKRKHIQRRR